MPTARAASRSHHWAYSLKLLPESVAPYTSTRSTGYPSREGREGAAEERVGRGLGTQGSGESGTTPP